MLFHVAGRKPGNHIVLFRGVSHDGSAAGVENDGLGTLRATVDSNE
jgi:hypothetical protein